MKDQTLALALLVPMLLSAAPADAEESHLYLTLVPGRFALIGQHPDGGATYGGTASITEQKGRLRLVKRVGGEDLVALGTVERAAPGEADVLRFRWPGHAATCLVSSDLDNHSRLTCYWTIDGRKHEKPGLEAYFPTAAWP